MNNSTKTILTLTGVLLLLCFCCLLMLVTAGFAFDYAYSSDDDISIGYDMPANVLEGDEFSFTILIENNGEETKKLKEIDIYSGFLDGVRINSTTPEYTNRDRTELFGDAYNTYYYDGLEIAPGETLELEFSAVALSAGTYGGNFQVYTGDLFNSQETYNEIYIQESF